MRCGQNGESGVQLAAKVEVLGRGLAKRLYRCWPTLCVHCTLRVLTDFGKITLLRKDGLFWGGTCALLLVQKNTPTQINTPLLNYIILPIGVTQRKGLSLHTLLHTTVTKSQKVPLLYNGHRHIEATTYKCHNNSAFKYCT